MNKKNILFILHTLPWPMEFGGNQAMYNGVAAMADIANVYVTYVAYKKNDSTIEQFSKALRNKVTVVPFLYKREFNTPRKFIYTLSRFLDNRFFNNDIECFLDKQLKIAQSTQNEIIFIRDIITKYKIDIVQVEMLSHLAIVNSLPDNVKKIFVHHELGFVRVAQVLKETKANDKYFSLAETAKIQEIGLLNKYDDIIVLSSTDKQKLEFAGVKVPIHTSFAIVKQPPKFYPIIDDYHTLFYVGPSTHKPNFYALKWFLENCWNKLLAVDTSFKLVVIGRWDNSSIKQVSDGRPNLEFLGFVDNLSDILKNGIMIVPITIGSGIRMKILEAAANGIPVVSTTIGAEGLPLVDGENSFLADTPDAFVEGILKLSDKELRAKFVYSLDNVIREQYSFEALKENRRTILGL